MKQSAPDRLDALRERLQAFVRERDWEQFHSPKNLAMAMIVEAAELVELFQWATEQQSRELDTAQRERAAEEIADTFIYLLRLADVMGIDLIAAAQAKMTQNALKYPADRVHGSNAKYTEYS